MEAENNTAWLDAMASMYPQHKALCERIKYRCAHPDPEREKEIQENRAKDAARKQEVEDAIAEIRQQSIQQKQEQIRKSADTEEGLIQAGIPNKFLDAAMETILQQGVPEEFQENVELIRKYISRLKENIAMGTGIFLYGKCGTMKTTLACCIVRACLKSGIETKMLVADKFFSKLLHHDKLYTDENGKIMDKLETIPMLVIDDLGSEDTNNKWIKHAVERIIAARYDNNLPTVYTSNYSFGDLLRVYPERVVDRICGTTVMMYSGQESLRKSLVLE